MIVVGLAAQIIEILFTDLEHGVYKWVAETPVLG